MRWKLFLVVLLLLVLSGSARAGFPGRDGLIAFDAIRFGPGANTDVFTVNADGTGERRLTDHAQPDHDAAYSPDGTLIAFESRRDGDPEIYVMNADGGDVRRLTSSPGEDITPTWIDSRRIAFASVRDGNHEIYVMSSDGGGQTNVSKSPRRDLFPSGSAEGRIAFVSERDGNRELYVMNADGTEPRRLTNDPAVDHEPAWSPDGRRIAFTSDRAGYEDVYIVDANGGGLVRLTADGRRNAQPSWSPSGARIAYASGVRGAFLTTSQIWTVNVDGTDPRQVTSQPGGNARPDWQTIPLPPPPPPPPTPPQPPRLALAAPKLSPAAPRAGARLVVRAAVTPRGTRAKVTCSARAGAPLRVVRAAFSGGSASCTFDVPRAARGKRLTGRVRVTAGGASASRTFSARVR